MPDALSQLEPTLLLWLFAMIRPGAAFLAAPFFGAPQVPVQMRIILSIVIGMAALASNQIATPASGLFSFEGILSTLLEVVIGLAIGFSLQFAYSAALLGGEVISNAMGLGFAALANPLGGQPSPAISQLLSILAIFLFLGFDGHLLFIHSIASTYASFPPGVTPLPRSFFESLLQFSGQMFSSGLSIAFPLAAALIILQLVMAVISRSAPTLNLFAVGLPATLLVGLVLLALSAPTIADIIYQVLLDGLGQAGMLATGQGVANG